MNVSTVIQENVSQCEATDQAQDFMHLQLSVLAFSAYPLCVLRLIGIGRKSSQMRQSQRNTFTQGRISLHFVYATRLCSVLNGLDDKQLLNLIFKLLLSSFLGYLSNFIRVFLHTVLSLPLSSAISINILVLYGIIW